MKRLSSYILILMSSIAIISALISPDLSNAFYKDHTNSIQPAAIHKPDSSRASSERNTPTLGQLRKKYSHYFLTNGPRINKVALTFDDVPDPRFTPQILDILKSHGVTATFFANGHRITKYPDIFRRIHEEGHAIGNHSYSHPNFNRLSVPEFVSEIQRTEQAAYPIIQYYPKMIRPPYGEITEDQLKWAAEHSYRIVNWNVDSLDWKGIGKNEVIQNIMSNIRPGAIVLQHGGGGVGSDLSGTIQALPEVITRLQALGYELVTVPELLGISLEK